MSISPLHSPDAASSWPDPEVPGADPTGSGYFDGPGPAPSLADPEPDGQNLGRSAVAYVLPSPTGKPLRWRTYLALHSARADSAPAGREPGPPEAHGAGRWHEGRQDEVRIYPEPASPEWSEHAATAQDFYRSVFELRTD